MISYISRYAHTRPEGVLSTHLLSSGGGGRGGVEVSQEFICFDCTQTREMLHYGLHNKLKTVQRLRQTPARICCGRSRCKKMLNMWQFAISNGDQPICKRRLLVLDRRRTNPRLAPNVGTASCKMLNEQGMSQHFWCIAH